MVGGYGATQDVAMTQEAPKKGPAGPGQPLLPVTVRMIELALAQKGGDELRIHGVEPGAVLLVGAVEDLDLKQAAMEFSLNDATGRIRSRFFFPSSEFKLNGVKDGSYVSFVGTIKTEPNPHLSIMTLRLISTPDEISYHFIEAAHTALRLRKGGVAVPAKLAVSQTNSAPMDIDTNTPPGIGNTTFATTPDSKGKVETASPPKVLQGKRLQEEIQSYLERVGASRPEGLGMEEVAGHFKASSSAADVKEALRMLLEDGAAYTTIDDDHFLAV